MIRQDKFVLLSVRYNARVVSGREKIKKYSFVSFLLIHDRAFLIYYKCLIITFNLLEMLKAQRILSVWKENCKNEHGAIGYAKSAPGRPDGIVARGG